MGSPCVSVLVPIFNVEGYLEQCLESIREQTLRDIEIILIDDGSTDGSPAIVDAFARADARVRVLHKPNSGYGDSLNQGLKMAHGEWVAIVEPDDWVEPTMLEHLVDAAAVHEDAHEGERVDIVKAGYYRVIHEEGKPPREEPCAHLALRAPDVQPFDLEAFPELIAMHPSIWSAMYRRGFLEEFAIRFLPIPGAGWADNPFLVETMVAARAIVWVPEALYHYRDFVDGTLSHLADWRVITGRWAEMNAVLARYDVRVPAILEAHAWRGCAYLQMLAHDFGQTPELVAAARAMAATIDAQLVGRSRVISRDYKRALAHYLPPAKRAVLLASWVVDRMR